MRIVIIAIGSELVSGQTVDTNSALLARKLRDIGLTLDLVTLVGDSQQDIIMTFNQVFSRADFAIVTGGLGPTEDDRTRFAAAKVMGVDLVEDADSLTRVEQLFAAFGREMPASNRVQALFPEGAEILENPMGTARGFSIRVDGCTALFAPGVPKELEVMADHILLPILREAAGSTAHYAALTLHTFGLPESELADRLEDFVADQGEVELAYAAKFPIIDLRLTANAESPDGARAKIDAGRAYLENILGQHIFGEGDDTLASVTGALLARLGLTLALAESCTGGLVAAAITDVPGSSDYFLESAVTYSNQAKENRLGVRMATLEAHGAVSEETAREMAQGIRRSSGADLGFALTGIAGPDGGTADKPVGTVHMALAHEGGVLHWVNRAPGSRDRVRMLAAYAALNRIRRFALRCENPGDEQFNCTD